MRERVSKFCPGCSLTLSAELFYVRKTRFDGLSSYCKKCDYRRAKERAHKNWDKHLDNQKRWKKAYYGDVSPYYLYKDRPRKRIKEHDSARDKLGKAVRRGDLIKPDKCSVCLTELPKSKIHGHHEDYSKPLEVKWICQPCHGKIHRTKYAKIS